MSLFAAYAVARASASDQSFVHDQALIGTQPAREEALPSPIEPEQPEEAQPSCRIFVALASRLIPP